MMLFRPLQRVSNFSRPNSFSKLTYLTTNLSPAQYSASLLVYQHKAHFSQRKRNPSDFGLRDEDNTPDTSSESLKDDLFTRLTGFFGNKDEGASEGIGKKTANAAYKAKMEKSNL